MIPGMRHLPYLWALWGRASPCSLYKWPKTVLMRCSLGAQHLAQSSGLGSGSRYCTAHHPDTKSLCQCQLWSSLCFPISFFFLWCALLMAILKELSVIAVEVSPDWNKVLNQCEMLSERGCLYTSFLLCGWLQRIMILLLIQRQEGKRGGESWPSWKHQCKQLREEQGNANTVPGEGSHFIRGIWHAEKQDILAPSETLSRLSHVRLH